MSKIFYRTFGKKRAKILVAVVRGHNPEVTKRLDIFDGESPKMLRHTVLLGKSLASQNLVENVVDVNRFHSGDSIGERRGEVKDFY